MAYYYMKSHNSMNPKQKQNRPTANKSKLSINILTPSDNANKLVLSQQLHEEYEIANSANSTKPDRKTEPPTPNPNPNPAGRMKLRDYIFLAKTSAQKNASEKKKYQPVFQDGATKQRQLKEMKKSKAELRKDKYSITNSEMFKILKEEMDKEISDSLGEIQTLKQALDRQLRQHTVPSNGEMVMMYNLRSLIKTKLKKSIEEMKTMIEVQSKHSEEESQERVEIEIDISDTEFQHDFKLTPDFCAMKYLKGTQLRNVVTFAQ